jgi:hypothetical protein
LSNLSAQVNNGVLSVVGLLVNIEGTSPSSLIVYQSLNKSETSIKDKILGYLEMFAKD